ncbi:transglutaminase domain-containing protein, partial [Bifidobacterium adolescentis]
MRRLAAFACSSIATVALGLSVALPLSFAQNANSKIEQSTQVFSTDFSHSESASSGSVTLTASWNDPQLGSPTTFHVEGTGGSGKYLFRMDAPSYSNPGEYAFESVADPSRGEWTQYTSEATSHDYEFTMTASGTYNFRFFVMDKGAGVYYLRLNVYIQVSDPNYPSVSDIVSQTVSQSEEQTDGTEYAKAVWLHDWLIDQMKYDSSLKWSSAESALTRGLGTCQSYESAYSSLLTKAGIENAETRDTADGHTWNAVKLDGEWYQVDATWDDSDNNWYGFDQRHLYFGLTDELMAIAHPGHTSIYQADGYGQRSISLKDNYFIRSGEADQWADKYAERIQSHLDDLEESFMIGVDNANDPPSIRNIINGIIAYALNQKSWHTAGREAKLEAATNDTSFTFSVKYADVSVPVESVSVSGDGVKDGKLSLKSGASV